MVSDRQIVTKSFDIETWDLESKVKEVAAVGGAGALIASIVGRAGIAAVNPYVLLGGIAIAGGTYVAVSFMQHKYEEDKLIAATKLYVQQQLDCPNTYSVFIKVTAQTVTGQCKPPPLTQTECRKDLQQACEDEIIMRQKFCSIHESIKGGVYKCLSKPFDIVLECGHNNCEGKIALYDDYFAHDEL